MVITPPNGAWFCLCSNDVKARKNADLFYLEKHRINLLAVASRGNM